MENMSGRRILYGGCVDNHNIVDLQGESQAGEKRGIPSSRVFYFPTLFWGFRVSQFSEFPRFRDSEFFFLATFFWGLLGSRDPGIPSFPSFLDS